MRNDGGRLRTIILSLCNVVMMVGCDSSLAVGLGKTASDPIVETPLVTSFLEENYIEVRWSDDPGADEYILERAEDSSQASIPLRWGMMYRGGALEYRERGVANQQRYLYRLSKVRGNRIFGPSEAKLGVGSVTRRDQYEPNDRFEDAKSLDIETRANMAFYRASTGEEFWDYDWYSITVPAHASAVIAVEIVGQVSGDTKNYINIAQPSTVPQPVTNKDDIYFSNPENREKKITFVLYPYAQNYCDVSSAGGMIKDYIVKIKRIQYD